MPVSVGELLAYLRVDSAGFDAKIASARGEMRAAAGSADAMEGAVSASSAALAGAGRSAGVASSGTAKFKAAQLSAVAATERYNAVLAQGDASLARLASAEASVIRANERVIASSPAAAMKATTTAAAESSTRMAGVGSSLLRTSKMVLGLGAAFGVFELVKKSIDISKEAAQFQRSMLLIDTNANAGAAEVKKMTGAVLDMSVQTATAPNELANALYHVEQNGLRGGKALEALRAGAEGAKIGLADVEDTTNAMTIAVASGIHGMGNLQKAMGTMIAIAGTGDMRLKDLNEALSGGILSTAKGFGASLQDVAAVLATLGDNGIRGADAATALRQVLMGFSVPAAKGKKALADIGLTMDSLAIDMQKHGLVFAMNDLEKHMKSAGITGAKVGAFITEAFGKKAGAGLGVLMGEMDRVNTKFAEGGKGAASFSDKWTKTTQTTAFAFHKLGVEFQVAGIKLAEKLAPAAASAAMWLGTTLPRAARTLLDIVKPLGQTVGPLLVSAFRLLASAVRGAVTALAAVGHFLESHKVLFTDVAAAVLGMWAAFKAYQIARIAILAVSTAITRLAAAAEVGMLRLQTMSTGTIAMGTAMAGIGLIIAGVTSAHQEHARQVALDRAAVAEFTSAIEADNGALGANTRHLVENNLATAGSYQQALKMGISQKTLTDAVMGNAAAFASVRAAQKAYKGGSFDLTVSLGEQQILLKEGARNAKDKAAADVTGAAAVKKQTAATKEQAHALGATVSAYTQAEQAAKASAAQTAEQTREFQFENNAIGLVNMALDKLAGKNLSNAEAQTALGQATLSLTESFKQNGGTIADNTTKGLANRQAIESTVTALRAKMQAEADATGSTVKATSQYHSNAAALLETIGRLEGTNSAAYRYAQRLLKIPPVVKTKFDLDAAAAISHVNSVHDAINNIPRWLILHVGVNNDVGKAVHDAVNNIPGHAAGGTVPGSGNSDNHLSLLTPGEEVTRKPMAIKYRPLLKAINSDSVSGYAAGAAAGMDNKPASGKQVTIEKLEVNQYYPLPDTGKIALPHAMRAAALVLGGV